MSKFVIDVETRPRPEYYEQEDAALDPLRAELTVLGCYNTSANTVDCYNPPNIPAIAGTLQNNQTPNAIMHNCKFDQKMIKQNIGVWVPCWFDTQLAASLLPDRPKSLSLQSLCVHYLGLPPWKEEGDSFSVPPGPLSEETKQRLNNYNELDLINTLKLSRVLYKKLQETSQLEFFLNFLMPMQNLLAQVELRGVAVDRKTIEEEIKKELQRAEQLTEKLNTEYQDYIQKYIEEALTEKEYKDEKKKEKARQKLIKDGFNWGSTKQVTWLLHKQLKIPCLDHSRKVSTRKEVLEIYRDDHPVVENILELRSIESLSTNYQKWLECSNLDGALRTHFNLDVTRTGRLSSSDPINLQNIKRGAPRRMFVARPGHKFVVMDFGQIEPRLLAHCSKDPALLEAFASGQDFYATLMKGLLGLDGTPNEIKEKQKHIRNLGKTAGLAVSYGIGPGKLSKMLTRGTGKIFNYAQARAFIDRFYENFSGINWLRSVIAQRINERGYIINLVGRRVYMAPDDAQHKGINTLIQSSASDTCCITALAMQEQINIHSWNAFLVLLVHDELVWEIEDNAMLIKDFINMLNTTVKIYIKEKLNLRVNLDIEVCTGYNWSCKG